VVIIGPYVRLHPISRFAAMEFDDQSSSLSDMAGRNHAPVVSQLVSIGKKHKQIEHAKILYHIEELQCFQPKGLTLRRKPINALRQRNYLALSYTWDPSDYESKRRGRYLVEKAGSKSKEASEVRDCVLNRALRYMQHKRIPLLWIDRHSINQDTCEGDSCELHLWCRRKREAVEAMDIVYEQSKHPVGLLARPLDDQNELHLLGQVLCGHFVDDQSRLADSVGAAKWALHILYEITQDRWWTRAWTFQENYRGGPRMKLLIPHHHSLEQSKRDKKIFGRVPNELCISSVRFFEQATRLCLALHDWTARRSPRVEHEIQGVLWAAGRYNVILPRLASMTPIIVADVEARELGKPWDRLAIVANCCRYSIRLNSAKLKKEGQSLSLSMLAMCLLNGEILNNAHPDEASTASRLATSEFLQEFMYSDFVAPRSQRLKLTYNKSCRLADVELTQDGVHTRGHLWKLGRTIDTTTISRCGRPFCDPHGRLKPRQRRCLFLLKRHLQGLQCSVLVAKLENLLAKDARARPDDEFKSFSEYYMYLMATEVAAAIQGGEKLRLGSICSKTAEKGAEQLEYRGIFVLSNTGDVGAQRSPGFVFTSMQEGKTGSEKQDNNDLRRHVSLGVARDAFTPGKVPRLWTRRWLLGMCFFDGIGRDDVVFPWPRALGRVVRKQIQ